jgi:N-acetylneuraminic acid mutarotase
VNPLIGEYKLQAIKSAVLLWTPILMIACNQEITSPSDKPSGVSSLETAASTATWTSEAPLPTPRSRAKAATVNGIIYVIGGYGYAPLAGTYLIRPKVEGYDVASRTWTQRRGLPEPLEPNGATSINGKIYVAGGVGNERISKALYVYDPATNVWTRKADLPAPIAADAGHQGTINGKLYVYAGVTVNSDGTIGPQRFLRYNPTTNTWARLGTPSYARKGGAAGVINGRFYLIGGTLTITGGGRAYDVHVYDPATGWTKKPLGHYGLDSRGLAYAPLGGKLYIVGTNYGSECTYDVSAIYDAASNTLSSFSSPGPWRYGAAGAAAKGRFFVTSGYDFESGPYFCSERYNGLTGDVRSYTP